MSAVLGTTETTMLLWSVVLGLVQILIAAVATNKDIGLPYVLGSRDEPAPESGKTAGRLERASANFRETFGLFAVSIILVVILHRQNAMSALGAQLYFWSRLAYVPIYAFGIPVVRTIAWTVSIVGLVMTIVAALGVA